MENREINMSKVKVDQNNLHLESGKQHSQHENGDKKNESLDQQY